MSDYKTPRKRKSKSKHSKKSKKSRKSSSAKANHMGPTYNVNATVTKLSKKSFLGPAIKVDKFAKKVMSVVNDEGNWTKPIHVRTFGPLQLKTTREQVSYGRLSRAADIPTAAILQGKCRASWQILDHDEATGLTVKRVIDPLDVPGQNVLFRMGSQWDFKFKNNDTHGVELTLYLVKSKCHNPAAYTWLDEIKAAYEARYTTGALLTNDVWVQPEEGLFMRSFKKQYQIVWSAKMALETAQEACVTVPFHEFIYNHDSWNRIVGGINTSILKDSYEIYYRIEGKVSAGTTAETSAFAGARALPADRAGANDQFAVGTNSCVIDCQWQHKQTYRWSHRDRNVGETNPMVNYDDDFVDAAYVEANKIDGVIE